MDQTAHPSQPVQVLSGRKTLDTLKFLNFGTLENFAVIIIKLEKKRFYHQVMHPKDADSIANSADPDQTAPLGAV